MYYLHCISVACKMCTLSIFFMRLRTVEVEMSDFGLWKGLKCRKLRNIESSAKWRHLKKLTSKGTLRQVFTCLRSRTLHTPHLHIIYMYSVYLFSQGRGEGGRVKPEKRLEGQHSTQLGRKYQHD